MSLGLTMLFAWQDIFALPDIIQPWLLRWLAEHDDILARQAVALCPDTPVDVLAHLARDPDVEVRRAVAEHPRLPATVLSVMAGDSDVRVRFLVARHSHADASTLTRLSENDEWAVRLEVAKRPTTPRAILHRLLHDPEDEVRQAAAEAAGMTLAEVAAQLAGTPLGRLLAAALAPTTGEFELRYLARRKETDIRMAVALNPALPQDLLLHLACDPNEDVRAAVRNSGRLPLTRQTIAALMARDNVYERCYLAAHPQTPQDILERLCSDEVPSVVFYVARNPATPAALLLRLARYPDPMIVAALAQHPNASLDLLLILANDTYAAARQAVVNCPCFTPEPEIALELARHNSFFGETLARHPATPPEVLEALLELAPQTTCRAIITHPRAPDALRHKACLHLYRESVKRHGVICSAALLTYPRMPGEILARHAKGSNWLERLVVARHPNTPLHVVAALAHDGIAPVRAAAQARLADA